MIIYTQDSDPNMICRHDDCPETTPYHHYMMAGLDAVLNDISKGIFPCGSMKTFPTDWNEIDEADNNSVPFDGPYVNQPVSFQQPPVVYNPMYVQPQFQVPSTFYAQQPQFQPQMQNPMYPPINFNY